ncbi:MAG: bifunctional transaldolase/phosoglucose isomerase [Elusimicrobiota bacterium]
MNTLQQLWNEKQSFWLDYISRSLFKSGELKKYIEQDGLRGMTSNPTIFEKAISSSSEYDAEIKKLASQNLSTEEIFEELAVKDIQQAADALKKVFISSKGTDGYVSLEVNPNLANDTEATVQEALRLVKKVKRSNLMIKVPGTKAGIPAIEKLLSLGVNINVTLLFSLESYKEVLEAYVKALEMRVKKGQKISQISSVASFFVSRVDTIVNKHLDDLVAKGNNQAVSLVNKAGLANAKLAYMHFVDVVASPRYKKLEAKGAQVQRLLWASTGAKDKRVPDTIYIDELVGPLTVNTMPVPTIDAFRDHGKVANKLESGWNEAKQVLPAIEKLGISFDDLMNQLQEEGVKSFSGSFESLMKVVNVKKELLTSQQFKTMNFNIGKYHQDVASVISQAQKESWVKRVWDKDATLWKSDEAHKKIISNSLGWLDVVSKVERQLALLKSISDDVRKNKFTNILLLGMGGSSLCPEVLRLTYGKKPGFPEFAILDSTEPGSVLERAGRSKPEKTLYIVASKSGSTTEPNAFFSYFYDLVKKKKGDKAGDHFIAITDPGTQMEKIAKEKKFRHIVLNPSDIGGRYSALSFFGMLPAALMGFDVHKITSIANSMSAACSSQIPTDKNPGLVLGAILGVLAKQGRNKVTFILSKDIASFSTWVEQLIAESTGKEGVGILPVESEPIRVKGYAHDRVFISIHTKIDSKTSNNLKALKKAGHPIIDIKLNSEEEMIGEFFRWEFATGIAGKILDINPFDQPNVQESKDLTKEFLETFTSKGNLGAPLPIFEKEGVSVFAAANLLKETQSLEAILSEVFNSIKPGDYFALLAYLTRNIGYEQQLQKIRKLVLDQKNIATTIGFGPRFLHSTGQLHKGGDNSGIFLQITSDDKKDLSIAGEPFTFSTLKEAQALGDLSALQHKNRRALRIHFKDGLRGLKNIEIILRKVLSK